MSNNNFSAESKTTWFLEPISDNDLGLGLGCSPEIFRLDAGKEYKIGRHPGCDITVNDRRVSRLHAILVACGDHVEIKDRSTRGIEVVLPINPTVFGELTMMQLEEMDHKRRYKVDGNACIDAPNTILKIGSQSFKVLCQ